MSALARLSQAVELLAKAKTLSEIKAVASLAEAAKTYARAEQLGREAENHAVEVALEAAIKGGAILARLEKGKTGPQLVRDSRNNSPYRAALVKAGMPIQKAGEWQRMAGHADVVRAHVRTVLSDPKAELTRDGALAAVKRVIHEGRRREKATEAAQAIERGAADFERLFKLQRYDIWNIAGREPGFGEDWPGNIPASLVANVLYYFTAPADLVIDPMAGGGVTGAVCKALGRRCLMADLNPGTTSIQRHDFTSGPIGDEQAELVFLDPPYWTLKAEDYENVEPEWTAWQAWLGSIAKSAFASVRPGGYCTLLMQDNLTKDVEAGQLSRPSIVTSLDRFREAGFVVAMLLAAPLSTQQATARDMEWAKQHRRLLGILRLLLIFQRPMA